MRSWTRRTTTFARFTLVEYLRSWRIMVEVAALIVVFWSLFWPRGSAGLGPDEFFTLGGLFAIALAVYTTLAMLGLGNRRQGYVVMARPLGRSGYLLGLYLAALAVVIAIYLTLTLLVVLVYLGMGASLLLTPGGWLLGSLPLLLDLLIVSSFAMLVAPLVVGRWPRILALGLLVLAFSADVDALDGPGVVVSRCHQFLELALLPAIGGFRLAVVASYGPGAAWVLLSQVGVVFGLVALSVWAFQRRDLTLG